MLWTASATTFFSFCRPGKITIQKESNYDPMVYLSYLAVDNAPNPSVIPSRKNSSKMTTTTITTTSTNTITMTNTNTNTNTTNTTTTATTIRSYISCQQKEQLHCHSLRSIYKYSSCHCI